LAFALLLAFRPAAGLIARQSQGVSAPAAAPRFSLEAMEKAVAAHPQDFSLRLALANGELAAARPNESLTQAQNALALAKTPAEQALARASMGLALLKTGDEARAQTEFMTALRLDQRCGVADFGLGENYLFERRKTEAVKYFERAIQASPNLAAAYPPLARLELQSGNGAQARQLLEKALTLSPSNWATQFELAKLMGRAGQTTQAIKMLDQITAAQPDYLPAKEELALIQLREGDLAGAQRLAEALVAGHPRLSAGHRVMALVFWKQHQTAAALDECAEALAADPHSVGSLALQALALWKEKRRREAQEVYREAGRADPSIGRAEEICRLTLCDTGDIGLIEDFVKKNRWVLAPEDHP
jgi:tetratricopeptide (TPR) repeat protein